MRYGRLLLITATFMTLLAVRSRAEASWPFGEENVSDKSGLDLEQGFDRNTVVTQRGRIVSFDLEDGSGPALAVISSTDTTTTLVLGPKRYWRDNGFILRIGDEVTAKGSRAVGRDETSYLIVQSIGTAAGGNVIVLRSDTGRPVWAGSGWNNPERHRQRPLRQHRGGRLHR